MTAVTIRAGLAGDARTLSRLHAQCFEQAWDERAFALFLDDAVTFALLAGPAGEEQAFILVRAVAGEGEILSLGTQPGSRRLGLARALIKAAAVEAHRRGARRMFLEAAADNEAALALYGQAGFTAAGRRRGYYARTMGGAADAVILSAPLPGFS